MKNFKKFISAIIFALCVIVLIINFYFDSNLDSTEEFSKIIILSGVLVYTILYFVYVVIIQHYPKLKTFFYEDRIHYIQKTIERNNRIGDEIINIFIVSVFVNFFVVYFLIITTPNQIISRIPGFEGITLFSDDVNGDLFGFMEQFTRFDYFLPIIIIGVTIVFILRFLRLRRINNSKDGYPGTNPLLAFMYAILGVLIIQGVLLVSTDVDLGIGLDTFVIRIAFAGIFSLVGVLPVLVAIILDRFLLRDLKLN